MGKEKVKKPFFKRVWVWIVALVILLFIILGSVGGGDGSTTTTATKSNTQQASPPDDNNTDQANKPQQKKQGKDLKKKYKQIRVGDTLTGKGGSSMEEVYKLLGKPDSTTETSMGNDGKMVMADWDDLWNSGSTITVTFINKHVSDKTLMQFN